MTYIEMDNMPTDWTEYKHKFVKITSDNLGLYFVKSDGSTDYLSLEFFDFINSQIRGDLDTLIALSGKYTSDDIIKFKREGMI
jgi:hypothetical protein